MKATIEIADNILERAKELAKQENSTLRELTEEGLRLVIERHQTGGRYQATPVTYGGNGYTTEFKHSNWGQFRDAIYADSAQ